MSIQCPYCLHLIELKGADPGRFSPRCPSCRGKFILVVHRDSTQPPTVAPVKNPHAVGPERLSSDIEDALGIEKTPVPATRSSASKPRGLRKKIAISGDGETAPPSVARHDGDGATLAPAAPGDSGVTTPPPTNPRFSAPAVDPAIRASSDATLAPPDDSAVDIASPYGAPTIGPGISGGDDQYDATRAKSAEPQSDDADEVQGRLGGYDIVYRLGRGGMGSVYLARQISLNRNVALKTLLKQLAADAQFVARFTREAYAAAQLTHHNVVQIYDIGAQQATHFFSMEFVEGQSLGTLLRDNGRLDPQVAVGYILQAARGLKFAHEHGMVHRDIKPDNLLLNRHGMVKVADLGLVKVPSASESEEARAKKALATGNWYDNTDKTDLNISMGTPAYMPPEQARDAARVDQRADVYSLGCALFTLVVGHPPFKGHSADETIQKHLNEPFPPPENFNDAVGPTLSFIIQKMCAKRREDRYQTMGEVIEALENLLGVESTGDFIPKEDQTKTLENCVKWFNEVKWAGIRQKLVPAFFGACGLAILGALVLAPTFLDKMQWAGGFIGFAVMTPIFYLLLQGTTQKTFLMSKVREFAFGAGVIGWVIGLVIAVLIVAILVALNLHLFWLAFAGASIAVAVTFHYAIDPAIARDRKMPLDNVEQMLKSMRSRGINELAVQQFVCKFAGENWEEFYETLFGYESKMLAREKWGKLSGIGRTGVGDRGRARPKFAAWRDPIIAWIDEKQKMRREAKERRLLEKIEAASLRAKGFGETAARKKAKRTAESIVIKAAELREEALENLLAPTLKADAKPEDKKEEKPEEQASPLSEEAMEKRKKKKAGDEEGLEGWEHLSYFQRRYGGWQGFFLGPLVRFGLGAVLLFACLIWAHQNKLFEAKTAAETFKVSVDKTIIGGTQAEQAIEPEGEIIHSGITTAPLALPGIPEFFTGAFDSWIPGLAGLLLMLSAIFQGPNLGVVLIPSALLMVFGPRIGIPNAGSLSSQMVSAILGLIGIMIGFFVARK